MRVPLGIATPRLAVLALLALLGPAGRLDAQPGTPTAVLNGEPFALSLAAGGSGQDISGRPAIASDGTTFLVGWTDTRNGIYDVYVARVQGRTVLDPNGIRLSERNRASDDPSPARDDFVPSIAFDGTNFLVVWVGTTGADSDVYGARVTPAGTVLDVPEVRLTTGATPKRRGIAIASSGAGYLVAWRNGIDHVRATRISTAGASLDGATGFAIASAGGDFYPWAAYGGGQYLVAWHGWGAHGLDVFAARVMTDGTVLEPEGLVVNQADGDQDHVSVASDGTNFLITWRDLAGVTAIGNGSAYAARVSSAGAVLDATPIKVADRAGWQVPLPVTFDSLRGTYFVVWHSFTDMPKYRLSDVYGRHVSTAGTLLDDRPIPIETSIRHQWAPTVAYGGGKYLVAWNDHARFCPWPNQCPAAQLLDSVATGTAVVAPTPPPVGEAGWSTQSSPVTTVLNTIAGVDDTHVYAVGEAPNGYDVPILKFDGSQWTQWNTLPTAGRLYGLWARAPDDVWGAGFTRFTATAVQGSGTTATATACRIAGKRSLASIRPTRATRRRMPTATGSRTSTSTRPAPAPAAWRTGTWPRARRGRCSARGSPC